MRNPKKGYYFESSNRGIDVNHHVNPSIKIKIYSIMKNSVNLSKSDKVMYTIITLVVAYFVGQNLLALFQSYVLPFISIRQDEVLGFLSLASAIPVALKVKALKYPISIIDHTTKTGRNRKGVLIGTDNGRLDRELWYLALHSDFKSTSVFDSQGYSVENKKPVYLVKPEYCNGKTDGQIVELVQSFLNNGLNKEMKATIDAKIAAKDAIKESEKAAKVSKKVFRGSGKTTVEEVAKLDIALERGLIDAESHKIKLMALLGI